MPQLSDFKLDTVLSTRDGLIVAVGNQDGQVSIVRLSPLGIKEDSVQEFIRAMRTKCTQHNDRYSDFEGISASSQFKARMQVAGISCDRFR